MNGEELLGNVELFSDEETRALILSLAHSRGLQGRAFNDDDLEKLEAWATQTRVNNTLLDLILGGYVRCDVDAQGEVTFSRTEKVAA